MRKLRPSVLLFAVCVGTISAGVLLSDRAAKAEIAITPSTTNNGTGYCSQTIGSLGFTLPLTITTPGVWCLSGGMAYNNAGAVAITINVATSPFGVVLDFGGYHLNATATGKTAISVTGNSHYLIRNGGLTNFDTGISVSGSAGNVVIEKMLIAGSTSNAISLNTTGPVRIKDCYLQDMPTGILVTNSGKVSIRDSIILDQTGSTGNPGAAIAFVGGMGGYSGRAIVDNNQMMDTFGNAISVGSMTTAVVLCRNNLAVGVTAGTAAFIGCATPSAETKLNNFSSP